MIHFLLILVGIVGLVYGVKRATTDYQPSLRSGNYRGAAQIAATGLLTGAAGFTVLIAGITFSIIATIVAAVAAGAVAWVGGKVLLSSMQKQVSGG